jgi:hypothetical protein
MPLLQNDHDNCAHRRAAFACVRATPVARSPSRFAFRRLGQIQDCLRSDRSVACRGDGGDWTRVPHRAVYRVVRLRLAVPTTEGVVPEAKDAGAIDCRSLRGQVM